MSKLQFQEGKIDGQRTFNGKSFPLVLVPNTKESISIDDVLNLLKESRDWLLAKLAEHGVIFFRDFPVDSANDFNNFLSSFNFHAREYIGGGGPRIIVVGNVMTSTESPPEYTIPLHHELAYLTQNPNYLFFWCDIPTKEKGETPVCLSNELFKEILAKEPELIKNVQEKKLRYTRHISADTGDYQKGWKDIFQTTDRAEAEKRARESGHETIQWKEDGTMTVISQPLEGVVIEPRTNLPTWFNSLMLLHPAIYGKGKPWNVTYGDFSEIPTSSLETVASIMESQRVALLWQRGDVMWVDNRLALHARNSFTPPRRILAAFFD